MAGAWLEEGEDPMTAASVERLRWCALLRPPADCYWLDDACSVWLMKLREELLLAALEKLLLFTLLATRPDKCDTFCD